MRVLLVHQNFPGQFKFLAPALASDPAVEVTAFTMNRFDAPEIRTIRYEAARGTSSTIHPWVGDFETKVIRGEAAFRAAVQLRDSGYVPDVIVAHPGWGESLFLKDVWPGARLGIYCEFFYHASGADVGFDPEFATSDAGDVCRMRIKNVNNLMHFEVADAGIAPTHWQASTFPERFRSKITVVHDGIDTASLAPRADVALRLNDQLNLSRNDEIITFVNRDLEPYRGFHRFMRALPRLMAQRPNARVLIVGGDDVSYGVRPADGRKWKDIFLEEVRGQIDLSRLHFLGRLKYDLFTAVLQLSTVHVYLTYPFVLSWSLLEAMSIGCAIVASDTQPLHEAIEPGVTGELVDFFDADALADTIGQLLADPERRARLGANARAYAVANYDLKTVCLPRQVAWVKGLGGAAAATT